MSQVNFLTVHAATQSQPVMDRASRKRADRSVLNNIIPYSTGASEAVRRLIPGLRYIFGTAVRVPTSDVSMIDMVIVCPEKVYLSDIIDTIRRNPLYGEVFYIQNESLVSSDFRGNQIPCIVDGAASEQLSPNSIRLVVWYDNETSYCAQVLRLLSH
jgi:glyceraldehyde 3-phosphate dehydrogenase